MPHDIINDSTADLSLVWAITPRGLERLVGSIGRRREMGSIALRRDHRNSRNSAISDLQVTLVSCSARPRQLGRSLSGFSKQACYKSLI
jgi:hypothetical protein